MNTCSWASDLLLPKTKLIISIKETEICSYGKNAGELQIYSGEICTLFHWNSVTVETNEMPGTGETVETNETVETDETQWNSVIN